MKYRHLFFDLDHTLWDFETNAKASLLELYRNSYLAEREDVSFDFFYERYSVHNHKLWDLYTKGRIKQSLLKWKRVYLALVDCRINDETLAKEMSEGFMTLLPTQSAIFPYTIEILDYLKSKNYPMSLITNGFEDVQAGKLAKSNLHSYFQYVVTSEGANSLKPQPEIFQHALRLAGVDAKDAVMIGDNQTADIGGANNIGMDTIFVNHIHEEIKIPATYTIYALQELENIL